MAITLTNQSGADYQKYIWVENNAPTKTRTKDSILFDFSMVPWDSNFVQLTRGSYIIVDSTTYPKWFTGYITSDPEYIYLGSKNNSPVWGYKYQATSDDYILNLSTVGIQPTFIGQTMGQVIIALSKYLYPGVFDTTNVQDGLELASYYISPDKRFKDVVKEFCDSANYFFYAQNNLLYFVPQSLSTSTLTLDMSNKHFTPSNLTIRPSLNQIINDVVVVGDIAPQAYVDEYIVGDGFTGSFPLLTGVYGADKYILLQEDFQGNSISTQNWTIVDQPANYLQLYNGYLNVLGGENTNAYDVYLQSLYPIALEGVTRITHGEFDFLPQSLSNTTTGIIGGLWNTTPNSSFTGCIFGIETFYNGSGVFGVRPVINGTPQVSMFQLPDTSGAKRYIFRTIMTCNSLHRRTQPLRFRDKNSVVQTLQDSTVSDTAFFQTYVSEVDVTTGLLTNSWKWENDNVAISDLYASYIPVVSNNATLTLSGITLSVPLQASLDRSKLVAMDNNDFDSWTTATSPSSWGFFVSTHQEVTTVVSGSSCKLIATNTAGGAAVAGLTRPISKDLTVGVPYVFSICVQKSASFTAGNLTVDITDLSGTVYGSQIITSFSAISSSGFTQVTGAFTSGFLQSDLNAGLYLRVFMGDHSTTGSGGYAVAGSYLIIDDLIVRQDWESLAIGPNDLDSLKGDTTVATIVSSNNLAQTTTQTGTPTYFPGESSLVFFKDTALQTSTQPQPNELYRLSYRASGNCYGRATDVISITSEAGLWADSGIRSVIKTDTKPRPRNVRECQLAASSIVGQDGYQHFEGSYTQFSDYLSQEPIPGSLIHFTNKPSGFASVVTEEINSVNSILLSNKPIERFNFTVNFGEPDYVKKTLAKFALPQGSYLEYAQGQSGITQVVDINSVLANSAEVAPLPVTNPTLTNWDSTSFTVDPNQSAPSGGGFEVRSSDSGWGCDDGKNLITRTTGKFIVSRQDKPLAVFIKPYNIVNLLPYSECVLPVTGALYSGYTTTGSYRIRSTSGPNNRTLDILAVALSNTSQNFSVTTSSAFPAGTYCWSFSVKPLVYSSRITLQVKLFSGASLIQTFTFPEANGWQRYSFSFVNPSSAVLKFVLSYSVGLTTTLQLTQFSLESGVTTESIYCKTGSTPYGANSVFPSVVKISFPPVNGPIGAYVDSTLTVDTINSNFFVSPPTQVQTIDSSFVIVADASIKSITSASDVTINTVPVINSGKNGQYLTIINVGSNIITLPCSSTLSGSTIATPTDVVLSPNGLYDFIYLQGIGWVQSSGSGSSYGSSGFTIKRYF